MPAAEMRRLLALVEGRDAPLYHWMDDRKALTVLSMDILPARWHHIVDGKPVTGTSASRNSRYRQAGGVRLTLDQTKLAQRHRIIPLAADLTYIRTQQAGGGLPGDYDTSGIDRQVHAWLKDPHAAAAGRADEEFIVGDIQPLHGYVQEILLATRDPEVTGLVEQYAKLFGIPVT